MKLIQVKKSNYMPTFEGKHNATRCKAWLVLYDRYLAGKSGLKLRELAKITGLSYKSLSVSLSKWVKWSYVGYRSRPGGREYWLRKRGRRWIDRWQNIMPLDRYIGELENAENTDS